MNKKTGLHLYINISNFNDILEREEENYPTEPKHAIHALDTFFSSIEDFCKHRTNNSTIEKITGARLHIYIEDSLINSYNAAKTISQFSYKLSSYLLDNVGKYKSLIRFKIQVGLAYGNFYIFEFNDSRYSELTSIGYAANFAAKLQALAHNNCITIPKDIFEIIPEKDKSCFNKINDTHLKKYEQDCFYTSLLSKLSNNSDFSKDLELSIKKANEINLYEMSFNPVIKSLKYDSLSKKECKTLQGIPFFADVRNFTSKFNEDDSNLEQMTIKTQNILQSMYTSVIENNGIHVQFQGDREFALFHNYKDYTCYKDAILAGLRIIDVVKTFQVNVGIGQSLGKMYASKIGARGEKDHILLGKTVNEADTYEDEYAKENQIVISSEIYQELIKIDSILASQFYKDEKNEFYITTQGYEHYSNNYRKHILKNSTKKKNYNGAWLNVSQ